LPLILGRDRGAADVVIEDPGVSGRHARVFPENGALVVEDHGSSDGTYAGCLLPRAAPSWMTSVLPPTVIPRLR
jgi:FHA domain